MGERSWGVDGSKLMGQFLSVLQFRHCYIIICSDLIHFGNELMHCIHIFFKKMKLCDEICNESSYIHVITCEIFYMNFQKASFNFTCIIYAYSYMF